MSRLIFHLPRYIIIVLLTLTSACQQTNNLDLIARHIPSQTQQLLVVLSHDDTSTIGELKRYQKKQDKWERIGAPIPVQLGRSGLAWGAGLHQIPLGQYTKREGDGKAPAGIFELGTAFGYHAKPDDIKLPYRIARQNDYYVDDVNASDYNQWVELTPEASPTQRWESFEYMRRDDHRYELGLEVQHNKSPIIAGNGSAIFLHVWKDQNTATAGCTAMSKDNMLEVLQWLDPDAKPLLIQVAQSHIKHLAISQ